MTQFSCIFNFKPPKMQIAMKETERSGDCVLSTTANLLLSYMRAYVDCRDRLHTLTKSCNPQGCCTDVPTLWIYSSVKAWTVAVHLSLHNSGAMNYSMEYLANATSRGGRHTHTDMVVSCASPYPPPYGYYAITEGRVWSDSTGFRDLCRNVCRPIRLQVTVFVVNVHL